MEKTYHLNLTIGDDVKAGTLRSRQEAIDAIIEAFMDAYPEDDDIHDIPEPIEEGGLRSFIRAKGMEGKFHFQITETDAQGSD
ncbi:hypothetical protein [Falsirhodobacter xinxiangensis]|uniref:hypothetical protein n=1 Tax=Falsirhodobacter xinxiangensis TaxID=2530049 RepID=UPI0010AB35B4|nr:hypothetical protein [Rhodobacter xinxiangensis]